MPKPNSRSSRLLAALLLVPLGIGGSAAGCELDEVNYTAVESECMTLLRTLRDPRAPGPQEVAKSIGQLGLGTLEELFVILETREIPNPVDLEESAQALSEPQTEAILKALELIGRGNAFRVWSERYSAALSAENDEAAQVPAIPTQAAIRALGGFGNGEDLELIWSVLRLDESAAVKLSRSQRTTLVDALVGILGRDHDALPQLQQSWDSLPDAWVGSVVRAIGRNRDSRGNQLLLDLIQFAPDHARLASTQIQVLGPTNDVRCNAELSSSLFAQVASTSKEDAQAAILAIGVLEDEKAIVQLIELLDDERPGVPQNAAHALKSMTTLSLHPSRDVWKMWRQGELRWEKKEKRVVLARLDGRDPNIVKAALREIGRHQLGRHELARKVVPLLMNSNVSVRIEAARVLGDLQSRWGADALVGALRDSSEAVRDAAYSSLKRISGREFGPIPEEWEGMNFP